MSILFSKKRKEREPYSPTLPEVENMNAPSPSTPHPQVEADEMSESVELSVQENEGSPQSKQQIAGSRNFSHGGELRSTNSGASIGHHTDESLATEAGRRPRVSSTASSVQSYTTAHGSPLPSRAAGKKREEEVMNLFTTMRDELLQSMREIRDKMSKLEGKMDGIEKTFESRMAQVEKQIQSVRSDIQSFQANGTVTGEIALSPSRPATLPEVNEGNDVGELNKDLEKGPQTQQKSMRVIGHLAKRFTDTDFLKVSHYRQVMKRKKFSQKKALSVQDSRSQLPQKECSQEMIMWLTQKVIHWKFIARWLGLQESDVVRIVTDHPQDDREQCYQMFMRWRCMDPENFTYHVLGEALRRVSQKLFNDYVEEVHRVENKIDIPDHD